MRFDDDMQGVVEQFAGVLRADLARETIQACTKKKRNFEKFFLIILFRIYLFVTVELLKLMNP